MSEADAPSFKADPETMALRAQPRPVVRLNRRVVAVGAGTLAAAVLGGSMWSLQSQQRSRAPAAELFNVDRIAKSKNLDRLPNDMRAFRRHRRLRRPCWVSRCQATSDQPS